MSRYVRSFPVYLRHGAVVQVNLPADVVFLGVVPPGNFPGDTAEVMFVSSSAGPSGNPRTFTALALGMELADDDELPLGEVIGMTMAGLALGFGTTPWAVVEVRGR